MADIARMAGVTKSTVSRYFNGGSIKEETREKIQTVIRKHNLMATSQWAYIQDKWYLFDTEGNMITGWKKVEGKWYYLKSNGEMVTGWNLINNAYYFMDRSL